MKRFDVHVCTISKELTPNYIPVVHEQFMPSELVLLASRDMGPQTEHFIELIRRDYSHIKIEVIDVDDIYNMTALKEKVDAYIGHYLETHTDVEKQIVLNATGGTKLMSFELVSLFNSWGLDSFYFKIENNEVLFLNNNNHQEKSEAVPLVLIPKRLNLRGYIKLHGHEVVGVQQCAVNKQKKELFEELIRYPDRYQAGLTQLNYEINRAPDSILKIPLSNSDLAVVNEFVRAGVCKLEGNQLMFSTHEDKAFVRGGWFEDYVYHIVSELNNIQALELNVQIKSADKNTHKPNELDVSFMRNNRLYIIECKTANYEGEARKGGVDSLNKLQTFNDLGGRATQLAFVSYFPVSPDMRDRARGNNINVIDGREVQGLKKLLDKWSHNE